MSVLKIKKLRNRTKVVLQYTSVNQRVCWRQSTRRRGGIWDVVFRFGDTFVQEVTRETFHPMMENILQFIYPYETTTKKHPHSYTHLYTRFYAIPHFLHFRQSSLLLIFCIRMYSYFSITHVQMKWKTANANRKVQFTRQKRVPLIAFCRFDMLQVISGH